MREDAKKLLCLRPRRGGTQREMQFGRRKQRWKENPEDAPKRVSMKKIKYREDWPKEFSEYFPAIMGFLRKSVGKPWDKVYSEICAHCDKRSAIGAHMFQHLFFWVERRVVMIDKKPHYFLEFSYGRDGLQPLTEREGSLQLYVHPKTGILLHAPREKTWRQARRERKKNQPKTVVKLGQLKEFRRRNGVWYYIEYCSKLDKNVKWDEVQLVMEKNYEKTVFSSKRIIACKVIRQLNSKELRRHSLHNC